MKILVIPDKFKGSLTARQAGEAIRAGLLAADPELDVEVLPIADGGEGFAEVLGAALGFERVECPSVDARGRDVSGSYFAGLANGVRSAVVEMSVVNGLAMLAETDRDPRLANTFGTGMLIGHAVAAGAKHLFVGLGGSATNDAGAGMAAALGWQFLDQSDRPVTPQPVNYPLIKKIDGGAKCLDGVIVEAAVDVDNPLLGQHGATAVYGPQKGLDQDGVRELEQALAHLVSLDKRFRKLAVTPGAGAAGGLGFGLMAFAGAKLRSGFDLVADALQLEHAVHGANLVITAEGHLDSQSGMGKAPGRIRDLAQRHGKKTLAIAGKVSDMAGFDVVLSLEPYASSLADSMHHAGQYIEQAITDWALQEFNKE